IGYVPHRQVELAWEEVGSADRRAGALLELLALLHRHGGGTAAGERLQRYALDLQGGLEPLPPGVALADHLEAVLRRAEAWMEAKTLQDLRNAWLLDPATAPVQIATARHMAGLQLNDRLPLRLLQAFDPGLRLSRPSPPAGPHLRLQKRAVNYRRLFPLLRRSPPPLAATVPFAERPFGVNLVGHAFDVFGVGEDIRMAARALQAAAIPCCVIDVPAGPEVERIDRRLEPLLCREPQAEWLGGPYAFNLVCMAAEIQARWLLQSGLAPLLERYTLAAWPWETDQWPEAWLPLLEVADELWPASRFTAAAQQPAAVAAGLPVTLMPMAAELEQPGRFRNPEARRQARQRHGLPLEAVLFAAAFDHNSTALRKNPIGALEAFQRAFPVGAGGLSDQVALMIKTFPPKRPGGEWRWLQARAAEDPRIHLVVACLEREELLALYGCCDAFVSLHRSEGFGRNLAEALQLGLEVVATDYSGNTDFCLGPQAWPVGWRRVPVPPGGYPNADGHHWAEPDGDHAAELLRQVAIQRLADGVLPHPRALETGEQVGEPFSFRSTGERYRRRLEELWAQRQAIGPQLRWRQAGLG
ncbi:MAG: glycosyltransferase, partial [Cyanobacteriota bacterium]|nr:glycosyltransferase [Cyanobacteriota bacterium]